MARVERSGRRRSRDQGAGLGSALMMTSLCGERTARPRRSRCDAGPPSPQALDGWRRWRPTRMHCRRCARVASRTHEGRTFNSAAACSTSSNGSSSDRARTGSTAMTDSAWRAWSRSFTSTDRKGRHPCLLRSVRVSDDPVASVEFRPTGAAIIPPRMRAKTSLLARTTERASGCSNAVAGPRTTVGERVSAARNPATDSAVA